MDSMVGVKSGRIIKNVEKIKRQSKPDIVDQKEEGSLFTDADFDVVSRLHFVNSKKAVVVDD